MTRAILATAGAAAAAVALSGCGGGGHADGTTVGTTAGAGGGVAGAARVGGPVLMRCRDTVATLSARAATGAQQQSASQLRTACQDLANASAKGASGDLAAAKQLAQQALTEAQQASGALR